MTSFRFRSIIFLLSGVSLLAAGFYFVQVRLEKEEIRDSTATKLSQILRVPVKAEKLQYRLPLQIALQGIQIGGSTSESTFSIGRIERLILGYGLLNLLRRDFRIPSEIRLDSPEILFRSMKTPFPFLDSVSPTTKPLPARWVILNGRFRYPWGGSSQELILSNVNLKAMPDARGQIQLELSSKVEGVASGQIQIRGMTDAAFKHYELDIRVENLNFLPESRIPLQKFGGEFHVSDQSIEMQSLATLFHDWELKGQGRIENWQSVPQVALDLANRRGTTPLRFSTRLDFSSRSVQGNWSWLGRTYPFEGEVFREGKNIIFPTLKLPHGYTGRAQVNASSGDYQISFERERKRFEIRSNLSHLDFETEFKLDHASVNRLDCVALGRARIVSLPKVSGDKGPRFKGEVQTEYFILEFEPLENLQGSFEFDSEGISAIDFRWGGVFSLGGRILFKTPETREDLVLRVEGFPLEEIGEFAGRPVPQNLRGMLEGKLKVRGERSRPEVQGYFTIKEGTINELDFDRAIIQLQGFPPYLRLYDSKIFRGRSTFQLTGAIDLTLQNYLHGIQIKGPDHLVIWKGMSAYWKEGESAIGAEKPFGKKMAMGLELGAGVSNSKAEEGEEGHAMVGPKVRF